ncbi:LPP20 family lipoprotein [Sulfurimonas sp.]
MKYSLVLLALLSASIMMAEDNVEVIYPVDNSQQIDALEDKIVSLESKLGDAMQASKVLEKNKKMLISVIGQGVAPMNTTSPAQAYALAKRAAVADAYRLVAEKVKGVQVEGQDLIKNMMVKRSTIRTSVSAMIRNANVVETTFKEGLCEVEMEIVLAHSQFAQ